MPRKPVRGRFSIVVPHKAGTLRIDTMKDKWMSAGEIVRSLRHYADFIEKHFVTPQASVASRDR